jgi:hypothetical protein
MKRSKAMNKVANLLFSVNCFDKRSPDGAMRAEYEAAVAESQLDVSLFDTVSTPPHPHTVPMTLSP